MDGNEEKTLEELDLKEEREIMQEMNSKYEGLNINALKKHYY